ncbi:hypothetical protein J3E64_002226 [Sphingobium sp. OAS761]|uniref:hypothetical protein n=1 Tax=Sphingobium sp. OAS761 TaxID=2817901 RepID=UPI00209DC047|nr:hypothetical protein [Sphingobium sp. OAS761]MCP1470538.1 hypothetical protein [Sphingobium sp. OAS761]
MTAASAGADIVAIPFSPPVDRSLVYRVDQSRTIESAMRRFTATRSLRFTRDGDGYRLQATLVAIDSDAPPAAAEPFRAALTPLVGVEMHFRLDAQGHIQSLDDMDQVWASVESGLARMIGTFAPDTPRHRAGVAVQALFAGLAPQSRLALLAGEYQPLLLFAGGNVDDATGRGVRTVAGSPLGRPVSVEGVLHVKGRSGDQLELEEVLAGNGVDVTMHYRLSGATGLVEHQVRRMVMGERRLVEERDLRPARP